MGSPITFSGFNSIDFSMILNAVMQQERAPLTALETQKKTLETQNTTFGTFFSKLSSLETAVDDLAEVDSLATLRATSSDTGVGVSTTSGTVEGTYEVAVTHLARAQVTASSSTYSSVDAVVATGGTLALLRGGDPPVNVTVTGSMTLQQLASAINENTDAPVTASVVQATPGSYRLVLTGRSTGAENAFTMTSTLTGGSGVTFTDDGNGIFGEAADSNTQNSRDASLTVNNLLIASSSNTVTDVIPGVTLSLTKEGASSTVKVTRDNEGVEKLLDKFITAYNDVQTFLKDQNTAAATGKTSIGRDPVLKSLRDSLRTAMLGEYTEGGDYSRLSLAGVAVDSTGKLKLDKAKLKDALDASTSSVQKLFAGTDGTGGIFGKLKSVVTDYTEAGGFVATVRKRIGDQVSSLSKRLDTLEAQLAVRKTALQREYIAADMAMTQLKAQSSSLSALGGQYRLF
jgi:flagellar hook-associated protein 2